MLSFAPNLTMTVIIGGTFALLAYNQAFQEYNEIQEKKEDETTI